MNFFAMSILFTISFSAFADGYYGRFWRGEDKKSYPELKKYCDDKKNDCFVELINRWLIPATPSYAAENALMAYAPVLIPKNLQANYHDEIALILYDSKEKYQKLRSDKKNIEGNTYGPIHEDIFDRKIVDKKSKTKLSRSLVPEEFTGTINLSGPMSEVSYDLKSTRADLINSTGYFYLYETPEMQRAIFLTSMEIYLNDLKKDRKINGAYALMTTKYLMLYLFSNEKDYLNKIAYAPKALWSTELKTLKPVSTKPLLYNPIYYGAGGNIFFNPGVKPGTVEHYRLHL